MPAIGSTEATPQQRKLNILRRGVHLSPDGDSLPHGVHVISVGGAGVKIVKQLLPDAPADLLNPPGSRLSAPAASLPMERARIERLPLAVPTVAALAQTIQTYCHHVELDYPLLQGSAKFQPWLTDAIAVLAAGGAVLRALVKVVRGQAHHESEKLMKHGLRRFVMFVIRVWVLKERGPLRYAARQPNTY